VSLPFTIEFPTEEEGLMVTLRIQHAVVDFDLWQDAFDRFAGVRAGAGVRGHTVRQPLDDDHVIVLDLEFGTQAEAERFRDFLVDEVWTSAESAPALVGTPRTTLLHTVDSR
jgi:hypothetical protein